MILTAFGYDGSVRIKADLDHRAFDRGLSSMTGQVNKFSKTLTNIAKLVTVAFGTAALVNFGREAVKAASALNDAWMGLQSIVEGQGRSFSKAKGFINDYISDGLVPLENAVTAYKNLAARGYSTEQIEQTLTALKDAAAFGRQASYSLGEAVTSATEGLKNENSILVDNAGVTKNVAKMWDEYARSIGTTANKLTQAQKIQAEVNGILNETRFQTGDAAKLVNTYSGQIALLGYNFQNLKVQVGNALIPIAQAVLPGINAIIAGLTKLATVFAKVTALLFGKSSQVTQTSGVAASASSASAATDKLADSLGGAGDAAKKAGKDMKSVTAPFDEFNILADSAAASADAAAGSLDMSGADVSVPEFEADTTAVEEAGEAFKSLGELFSETVDGMLAGIPQLTEAFQQFGANFNNLNQQLYDAFTFDGLKEKVQLLGVELAGAFNELVGAIDWRLWGQKLGAGMNLGLQFLVNFLYSFDWSTFGQQLGALVTGAVSEIDWYAVGQMMIVGWKIAIETLTGFLLGLDMAQIGQAASRIMIGFFDAMKETIAGIDWEQIGTQISEFLNNIDWEGITESLIELIGEAIDGALDFFIGLVENMDWEKLGRDLYNSLNALVEKIDWISLVEKAAKLFGMALAGAVKLISGFLKERFKEALEDAKEYWLTEIEEAGGNIVLGLLKGIIKGFTNIGNWIVDHIFKPFIDGFKQVFGINSPSTVMEEMGVYLVEGLLKGISDTWNRIIEFFTQALEDLEESISNAWSDVQEIFSPVAEWFNTNVIEPVKQFFTDLCENIEQLFSDAWTKIQDIFSPVAEWFNTTVIEPIKQFFTDLWENVQQLSSDAKTGIESTWSVVSGWFNTNVIKPVKEFFGGMWDNIKISANDAWDNIKGVWDDASTWFSQNVTDPLEKAFDAAGESIMGTINGLIGNVEGLINAVIRGVNWLISQMNRIKFDVPDWVPGIGGNSFKVNIPKISETKLPRLANGAVIPPNQQFAAILGDQRSGTNIEAPLATIRQAVTEAIQAVGGVGGDINITVESVLDGKVIARNTVNHVNRMTRSNGRSPLLGTG